MWRRKQEEKESPRWRLGISPGVVRDREEFIDGELVDIDKTCWTWTVIRDDLKNKGGGWLVDVGAADTQEEAIKEGLKVMRVHQNLVAS